MGLEPVEPPGEQPLGAALVAHDQDRPANSGEVGLLLATNSNCQRLGQIRLVRSTNLNVEDQSGCFIAFEYFNLIVET
jgi:hypothetical protein